MEQTLDGRQQRIDVGNADLLPSTTRSVRKRLDFERPVEREVLLECLSLLDFNACRSS